ncbi:MAG: type VI secretion system tip protein TssI/VgrG [Acetobacteraceae bacterium]
MITLDLDTSWAAGLTPVRATLREAISECYELTLDVLSDAVLPLTDALQHSATVTISEGEQRRPIPGIVTEMALMGSLPADRYWYRLVLVPRLRLLEFTRRSRVFCTEQPAAVGDLLQQVIAGAQGVSIASADVTVNLQTTTYPRTDMAIQYAETDLAFLQRRAEYAGVFYFFQTSGGTDKVSFGDANVCFPFVGGSTEAGTLSYRPRVGVADRGPAVRSVEAAARLITQQAQLNTRDWESPNLLLLVQSDPQPNGVGLHEWEEEDGYSDAAWGKDLARVRVEALAVDGSVLRGRSDCMALQAGYVFTLRDHDIASLNTRYVVTSVSHHVWESAAGIEFLPEQAPQGIGYGNSFTAIPLSVPYRPQRRTPLPRIDGILRAVVDGVDQARSDVDELGSYRIILPFDRTTRPPGKSSNRIRLITPYGGAAEGFHFPLRPGTQVMVAFVKGNPDWPVIVGPLYDAGQKSVVTRGNRYANVITTTSGITMKFYDGAPPASST